MAHELIDDFTVVRSAANAEVIEHAMRCSERVVSSPDESTADGLYVWHFPFGDAILDNFLADSGLLARIAAILDCQELLFNNCMLWVRDAADSALFETRFHRDYADNALVVSRSAPDAVGLIVYFSDVEADDGPTRYVPSPVSKALPVYPRWADDRALSDALDAAAVDITCSAGTALIHSLLGVHRATLPRRPGRRVSLHAVVRRADARWMGWLAWPRCADAARFRDAFPHLSTETRLLIGWPPADWHGWEDPTAREIAFQRFGLAGP